MKLKFLIIIYITLENYIFYLSDECSHGYFPIYNIYMANKCLTSACKKLNIKYK